MRERGCVRAFMPVCAPFYARLRAFVHTFVRAYVLLCLCAKRFVCLCFCAGVGVRM